VAQSIVESVRGQHPEFVFVYSQRVKKPDYERIETMNNTAWQSARKKAGMPDLHIHDLRHTVGMRLREADVRKTKSPHAFGSVECLYPRPIALGC